MRRVQILGLPIDTLTMEETIGLIFHSIQNNKPLQHVVVNAAKMVNAQRDEALRQSIVESDIVNADGQAVVWASRFLGSPLPERVAGIDLMQRLVKLADEKGLKIYFLGAEEDVVHGVVSKYKSVYSERIIAGFRNGYFSPEEEEKVASDIRDSCAHILFVAMTSPKKEIFLNKYKALLNIPFIMGVGGSFDVVAGKVKRAPVWMQRWGLEWLYRVYQEPKRMWRRYLETNTLFILAVLKEKYFSK
jgi:N-acetylglucosaminyldiphosphoundecaprenol N-acetyl-beta-D-mannosaminyltransferase